MDLTHTMRPAEQESVHQVRVNLVRLVGCLPQGTRVIGELSEAQGAKMAARGVGRKRPTKTRSVGSGWISERLCPHWRGLVDFFPRSLFLIFYALTAKKSQPQIWATKNERAKSAGVLPNFQWPERPAPPRHLHPPPTLSLQHHSPSWCHQPERRLGRLKMRLSPSPGS